MKRLMTILALLLAVCLPLSALAEAPTFFDAHGPLRVSGGQLTDASGQPVQLRGVSTLGLAWFPQFVNEEAFRTLRDDWGANVVRLAMYTCEDGGYLTDGDPSALEALIDEGVTICQKLGLYAIIDWHILSDGDPNLHADEAEDFFRRVSARYADVPNVLYEICNEPNGKGINWPVVKAYAQRIIPVIRESAPDAVILCGTPNWSQDVDRAAADPIDDDREGPGRRRAGVHLRVQHLRGLRRRRHRLRLRRRLAGADQGPRPVLRGLEPLQRHRVRRPHPLRLRQDLRLDRGRPVRHRPLAAQRHAGGPGGLRTVVPRQACRRGGASPPAGPLPRRMAATLAVGAISNRPSFDRHPRRRGGFPIARRLTAILAVGAISNRPQMKGDYLSRPRQSGRSGDRPYG